MKNAKCLAVGFTLGVVLLTLTIEANATELGSLLTLDVGDSSWTTGSIGDKRVNIISNDFGSATWTTGTIGDDSVNLLETQITEDWSWTTGSVGDDNVNVNKLEFDWEMDYDD